jgi:hypothetical protein
MFNKLFSLFKKEKGFDESFGNSNVKEFIRLLKAKNYPAMERFYKQTDWAEHSLMMKGIASVKKYSADLYAWNKASNTALSNLFLGTHTIFLAWEARSSAQAAEVSDDQFMGFYEHLQVADQLLQKSIEMNPKDPEPYAQLIKVNMGLSSDLEVLENYFKEATRLVPDHLIAHLHLIAAYNPKWLGSMEMMYDFAEKSAAKNSPLLLMMMHYAITENHLYYDMNEMPEEFEAFYARPETKQKVLDTYKKFKEPANAKALIPFLRSYMAYNLFRVGEFSLAKSEMAKNNYMGSLLPWAYFAVTDNQQLKKELNSY